MKTIVNILAFYLLMLAALPPLQGCDSTKEFGTETGQVEHNAPVSHHDALCSPFCGQDNCGIVIDFQPVAPPVIIHSVLQIERPDFEEKLVSISRSSLWHPPQTVMKFSIDT